MDRITKQELEQIVLNGIAADVFIAERAYSMFKVIGQNGNIIDNTNYKEFFKLTQEALKDRFLLAMARLFDKPSSKNKTRCILGLIDLIKKNSSRLPEILERTNLAAAMRIASFDENSISMIYQKNKGDEIALMIANHFEGLFNREDIVKLSEKLKEIRDTRLAHNDLIVSTKIDLNETLDVITFKELFSLIRIAKEFIGVIGWAYMSMVFVHDGEYHLTNDAVRPSYSLSDLISKLSSEDQ